MGWPLSFGCVEKTYDNFLAFYDILKIATTAAAGTANKWTYWGPGEYVDLLEPGE